MEVKMKVKPFNWHDNFSEAALEDFHFFEEDLDYITAQNIGQALTKLQMIESGELSPWIPCNKRMPEEHDSVFAKLKGTDLWSKAMFSKRSNEVNVTIEFEDGTRKTATSYTLDSEWKIEKEYSTAKAKVIAWMPLP